MPGLQSGGGSSEVIPKPKGDKKAKGSATTTDTYATITGCEITVTKDKTFQLAKIVVSCPEDVMVKIRWDDNDIGPEYYVMAKLPFTDWFPWDWNPCLGDGTKKLDVQAKYPAGGAAATVQAEISGEEA